MSKPKTIYFSQDLFGGWTLKSLREEVRAFAKERRVPMGAVVIDAIAEYDESPRLQLRAERLETKEEAAQRLAAEAALEADLERWAKCPPDSSTDPINHILYQAAQYRALLYNAHLRCLRR